jgi:hypothetical protein
MTYTTTTLSTPHNDGTLTSFSQLFGQTINGTQVQAIEIPLFQRDYAQGRHSEQARHIRERFIADLCGTLDDGKELHLDFVFGDVVKGTLYPLDGQQRLTTLFLLHCYLTWHLPETSAIPQPWHAFHYATRPGARAFCQFLTQCRPDMGVHPLSKWLRDEADYLPTWKHDPTIQGMLVVLDALHQHYRDQPAERLRAAWQRLIDPDKPAISFLLLPVAAQKLDNTLYVKMNSRGRPLTEFENFKAELEALLRQNPAIPATAVDAFSHKIDTDWADIFWKYRGGKHLIDEEFLRYLRFLFEVQAWKLGLAVDLNHSDLKSLTELSKKLLGSTAEDAHKVFDWMVQALDVWLQAQADGVCKPKAIGSLFSEFFTRQATTSTTPLLIFNFRDFDESGVDMFHACCALYGTGRWRLAHTLLLYGVLQVCMDGTPLQDIQHRLRLLRNLIEASQDEIRAGERNNMPALLCEVEKITAGGPLTEITTFNQVQVTNEQAKQAFLAAYPTLQNSLCQLEDHALLRGGLTVFDLDPAQGSTTFEHRAAQFYALFTQPYAQVAGALLAKGNIGRGVQRTSGYRLAYLGAPRKFEPWENLFRARKGEKPHPSTASLMALLDVMAAGNLLQSTMDAFLNHPDTPKNWCYYMVKYEAMRHGESGCYVISPNAGYSICMLKGDSCDDRSSHYDPYLMALVELAQTVPDRIGNPGWPRCFPGYETNKRYLVLRQSSLKVRCVENGWLWDTTGLNLAQLPAFTQIVTNFGIQSNQINPSQWLYTVAQQNGIDTEDRIEKGANLLNALIRSGM